MLPHGELLSMTLTQIKHLRTIQRWHVVGIMPASPASFSTFPWRFLFAEVCVTWPQNP